MTFCRFLCVLFALGDVKSALGFDGTSKSVVTQVNGSAGEYGRPLEYLVKIGDGEEARHRGCRQNFAYAKIGKPDYPRDNNASDGPPDKEIIVVLKPTDDAEGLKVRLENKSDPVAPLHVTNTARKECINGFKADENGICQKSLTPKGDKSFKLKRKKRDQQGGQKLSYAEVVKYGRNPPKNIGAFTAKPEVAMTGSPSEKEKFFTTTPGDHSKAHHKTTTPTPRRKELPRTLPPTIRAPVVTTVRTPPATIKAIPTIINASTATAKAPSATVRGTPSTASAPSGTVRGTPSTAKAPSATISGTPATAKALPTTTSASSATTPKPSPATTTKPVTIQKAVTSPSVLADINQAFLSVEKSSGVAHFQEGKVRPPLTPMTMKEKTFDPTRLRRWAPV